MRAYFVAALLSIGVVYLAIVAWRADEVRFTGKPAPDFRATTLTGETMTLADLRGKVVVLNFWATWCGPCVGLIPLEKEMCQKFEGKPFVFLAVSVDDDEATLRSFVKTRKLPWPVVFDGGQSGPIATTYHVHQYPTIYVIDAQGNIRYKDRRGPDLEQAVAKLLGEM